MTFDCLFLGHLSPFLSVLCLEHTQNSSSWPCEDIIATTSGHEYCRFTVNPLSLDRLWALLPEPLGNYVKTRTWLWLLLLVTRLRSVNPWFPCLTCFYSKIFEGWLSGSWFHAFLPSLCRKLQNILHFQF